MSHPYTPLGWTESISPLSKRAGLALGGTLACVLIWAHTRMNSFPAFPRSSSTSSAFPFGQGVGVTHFVDEAGDSHNRFVDRTARFESLYGMRPFEGRSWLDHIEALDGEGLAPMTHFTQRFLHEWQNPPLSECDSKKDRLIPTTALGALASLDMLCHLHLREEALDAGRILAWGEESLGRIFVSDKCDHHNLDCIFESVTHCPRSSMTSNNTVDIGPLKFLREDGVSGGMTRAPEVFRQAMSLSREGSAPYTDHMLKYWWRGQGAAYLMRVQPEGLAWLAESRLNSESHTGTTYHEPDGQVFLTSPIPWPLPKGTLSMHVRHGDKAREMDLIPFSRFVAAGETLATLEPNALTRTAFISSEDPQVFEDAHKISHLSNTVTTSTMDWTWYSSNINRINSGPFAQLDAFGNKTETSLSWMAELFLALECDAFVGTRGSNWNRLIDELRCIWTSSCMHPYVEVGPEKDWEEYNWK